MPKRIKTHGWTLDLIVLDVHFFNICCCRRDVDTTQTDEFSTRRRLLSAETPLNMGQRKNYWIRILVTFRREEVCTNLA